MKTKSILFTEKNKAELIEENIPEIGADDVLVKLAVSTVSSGTERANLTGEYNVTTKKGVTLPFPRRCGYSSSGIVKKVGENVTTLAPGERVALTRSYHSQYVAEDAKNIIKINDGITFEEAALWYIGTFPMAAVRKCHLEIGESAVVMGMGVLGMIAVMLLKNAGAVPVIAVDPVEEKRKKALEIGADYALDPFADDFANRDIELTGGGANVAIEVTGNGKALDQVLDCMARYGRVALLGCTRNSDFTIDYYKKVHAPAISLIGAHTDARPSVESSPGLWTTRDDVNALQKLVLHNRLKLSSLVEETHSPNDTKTVYDRLATEKSFPVVQFDWRKL